MSPNFESQAADCSRRAPLQRESSVDVNVNVIGDPLMRSLPYHKTFSANV